jgi:enoyl-CoA hydratase/carnithine racemase
MTVGYEVREAIAYLSFERPEKHNALRDEDLAALIVALERFDTDDDAQVAILFGQGKSFSSGGDVNARLQHSMDEGSNAGRVNEDQAFTNCANWKPIIAAVHGYCLGHALSLALRCDHLVAGRDATFQVTEIKLGLPMAGLVPQLGGGAIAKEVAMTGRMFSAQEAWNSGMVTRLVDEGEHIAGAEVLARQILENPPWAVRQTVRVGRTIAAENSRRLAALSEPFNWAKDSQARDAVAGLVTKLKKE